MKKMVILAGPSGSGKSTYAVKLVEEAQDESDEDIAWQVISADNYMVDKNGKYAFDWKKLDLCHTQCFLRALTSCTEWNSELVIVDNTNTRPEEISPYVALAKATGYDVELVAFLPADGAARKMLAERNAHGVTENTIERQETRLRQTLKEYKRVPTTVRTVHSAT